MVSWRNKTFALSHSAGINFTFSDIIWVGTRLWDSCLFDWPWNQLKMYENAFFVQTFLWPVYGLSAPINRLTSGDRLMQESGKMRIPANYLANMLSNMCQLVLLCQCLCFYSVNLTPLRGLLHFKVFFLQWEANSCANKFSVCMISSDFSSKHFSQAIAYIRWST